MITIKGRKMSDEEWVNQYSSSYSEDEEYSSSYSDEEQERLEEEARISRKRKLDETSSNNDELNKMNKQIFEDIMRFFIINVSNEISTNNPVTEPDKISPEKEEDRFGPELFTRKETIHIKFDKIFETLRELINLGEIYDPSINYVCNIDMKKLHQIVEPLKELDNMIGLQKFKKSIIDQIIYILTLTNIEENPMLHTCIYGPPGCGKTQISTILAKIYSLSGILSGNKFQVVKREDFVAGYLGHTAIKTKKLLESMLGGVLFLDEAYSMGSKENSDYFAKEALDTLNVFLSENYSNFILIIAGYEADIKHCFFAQNSGLERRFAYKFTIEGYSSQELNLIFCNFITNEGWKMSPNLSQYTEMLFTKHKDSFPFYGGDIKVFFDKCKIVHTKKLILLDKSKWKILSKKDIKEGFELYLQERDVTKDTTPFHMYL